MTRVPRPMEPLPVSAELETEDGALVLEGVVHPSGDMDLTSATTEEGEDCLLDLDIRDEERALDALLDAWSGERWTLARYGWTD